MPVFERDRLKRQVCQPGILQDGQSTRDGYREACSSSKFYKQYVSGSTFTAEKLLPRYSKYGNVQETGTFWLEPRAEAMTSTGRLTLGPRLPNFIHKCVCHCGTFYQLSKYSSLVQDDSRSQND